MRSLKSHLTSFPDPIDGCEVDLDRLEDVRNRTPSLSEALASLLPHSVQRDNVALPTWSEARA